MPKARHILSTLNFNEWYQRIESESGNSELRSDGQPRFPNLLYEDAFAQNALAHIAGIDFAHVNYQRGIEIGGKQYRIDFTIEEPGHVPIVIDIDGKVRWPDTPAAANAALPSSSPSMSPPPPISRNETLTMRVDQLEGRKSGLTYN
jgi:hypothetical protein